LRRDDILRIAMRDELMPGLHDGAHRCRRALAKDAAHHHACAPLRPVEHAQQSLDTAGRAVAAPRERIGVEGAGWQRVAHRTNARRLAVRPAFVSHVENHREVAATRPAKPAVEAHDSRTARHGIPAVLHLLSLPLDVRGLDYGPPFLDGSLERSECLRRASIGSEIDPRCCVCYVGVCRTPMERYLSSCTK